MDEFTIDELAVVARFLERAAASTGEHISEMQSSVEGPPRQAGGRGTENG